MISYGGASDCFYRSLVRIVHTANGQELCDIIQFI